jgi:protein-disulfide isomerase
LIFKQYPLETHPAALISASASLAAHQQGKFWPMHDVMFEHQDKLGEADLKQSAVALGLDAAKFDQCLESGRYTGQWKKDTAEGEQYGVSSTPAFFINGRLVVGAQPFESFARIVDEELVRAGRAPSAPAP